MSKHYKFLSEEDLTKPSDVVQTDWRLCILCQEDTNEKLINPGGGGRYVRAGCVAIADNIGQFDILGCMPMQIDIARLDDGSGISQTLQSNNACWHKSCNFVI